MAPPAATYAENCKQPRVAYPAVQKGEDLGVRSGEWAATAKQANERIDAGNACIDAVVTMSGLKPPGEK